MTPPLSQHERVRESCRAGGYVNRGPACKVQSSHSIHPASRVPGPASDSVVDDGRPDEHEDDAGKHAATLSYRTHGKCHPDWNFSQSWFLLSFYARIRIRDGSKHALIHCKQEIWYPVASHTRRRKRVPKPNIGQIPNVFTSAVGERERIAPEKPLKGCHAGRHHREPY